MSFVAFLDACVLFPENVRDVILTVAESGICEERLRKTMERAFPEAMTPRSMYDYLVPGMPNQEKDRHVLAAAVVSRSDVLVTANMKDFQLPMDFGSLEVLHPDQFLCHQLDLSPISLLASLNRLVSHRRPPMDSVGALLKSLKKTVPQFADRAARAAFGTDWEASALVLVAPTSTPVAGG